MFQTSDGWIREYQKVGALWLHDGNPERSHVRLTTGRHGSGYINTELILENSLLLDEACADLLEMLWNNGVNIHDGIDRVVGPAMGAITLADGLARHIARTRGRTCLRAYTEKETDGAGNTRWMVFKKTIINPTECVLLVEDVFTSGESTDFTAAAVAAAGGYVLPLVAVLVNRSRYREVSGRKIIALIDLPMPTWTPEECPLCKEGSEAIRPKGVENWKRLNASL